MITLAVIRQHALALPEVTEKPHFGQPSFRVRDKLFLSVHPDDPSAIVHVDEGSANKAATTQPQCYAPVWRTHGGKQLFVGLRINLSNADTDTCLQFIETAWRHRAPKRVVAAHDNG